MFTFVKTQRPLKSQTWPYVNGAPRELIPPGSPGIITDPQRERGRLDGIRCPLPSLRFKDGNAVAGVHIHSTAEAEG